MVGETEGCRSAMAVFVYGSSGGGGGWCRAVMVVVVEEVRGLELKFRWDAIQKR